jgi:hypothetical protein
MIASWAETGEEKLQKNIKEKPNPMALKELK